MRKKILTFFFLFYCTVSAPSIRAIYRPLSPANTDAVSTAGGQTGVSSINSLSSLSQNPSFAARLQAPTFSLGFSSRLLVSGFLNYPDVQLNNFPDLSFAMPSPYGGAGIMLFKSYENSWAANTFTLYHIEALYSLVFLKDFSVGISAGAGMGLQGNLMIGGGFSSSISGMWKTDKFSVGLLVRPPVEMTYDSFYGIPVKEVTPTKIQTGVTFFFNDWSLFFELDYVDWNHSSFRESGKEVRPAMQTGFLDFFHPHLGIDIDFSPVDLHWRLGIFTADDFDSDGFNSRQILATTGVYFHPGSEDWARNFQIAFSYTSGYLFSTIFHENYPIDKIGINLDFSF